MESLKINCLIPRHIGSLWDTAGVSLIAMFQMKCPATKLFPSWAGKAPKWSSAFIPAEIHHVPPFLLNCHCFPFGWRGIAQSDDFHSSFCLPFSGVCSRQVWSELVLNWQGLGAVHARKSGKDPPWAWTGLAWVLHLPVWGFFPPFWMAIKRKDLQVWKRFRTEQEQQVSGCIVPLKCL